MRLPSTPLPVSWMHKYHRHHHFSVLVRMGCISIQSTKATSSTTTTTIVRRTFLASSKSTKRRPSLTTTTTTTTTGSTKSSHPHHHRADVEGIWYTPRRQRNNNMNLDMGRYGLRRIDYHAIRDHPPVWTLPPHPPTKSIIERILFPLTLLLVGGLGVWAYMNPDDEDMTDYWKRVETGQILVEDDDDDDDDEDDDDDDDFDEWNNKEKNDKM
jgi:hypothetical protein